MENKYIYETHLHTSTASACGKSKGNEYISLYKELGFSGIFVTDHFFNGNCGVPKNLSWKERINLFCKGYEEAKEEGDKQGFSVFFGWECNFNGDEFLVYGLDKEWLLDNPDMLSWDHITHYNKINEAGGLVVQAHPFRERDYLSEVYLHPFQCDAWEVGNSFNTPEQNALAYRYAQKHNIVMTAGSDIHLARNYGKERHFGVAFDTPLTSAKDYADRIKSAKEHMIIMPDEDKKWNNDYSNHLPLYLFDHENKPKKVDCSIF